MIRPSLALLAGLLTLWGCDAGPAPEATAPAPPVETAEVAVAPEDLDPDNPQILRRPFTVEQIRDEWQPGLTILMQTQAPQGGALERWVVLTADESAAEIEFTQVDQDGKPAGDPRVARSTWIELRNHATFPAASASREETTLETALGELEGWLYRVRDDNAGTVTEYFFARSLPGAPVMMRVLNNGQPVMQLAQIERKPAGDGES